MSKMVQALHKLLRAEEQLHPPQLQLKPTMEAAWYNYEVLQKEEFQLEKLGI